MDKQIIDKLDLIIDDRYKYSNSTVLYGIDTYKMQDIDVSISQYDQYDKKDLRVVGELCLLFRYKNAYAKVIMTDEFIMYIDKIVMASVISEHMNKLINDYNNKLI